MGREHISPWRRTRRRHDAFRRRRKGPWSRSRKLADCIIATNDAQPDGHGQTVDSMLTSVYVTARSGRAWRPASLQGDRVRHGIRSGGIGGVPERFWRWTVLIPAWVRASRNRSRGHASRGRLGIISPTATASGRRRFWADCTTNIDWWRPLETEDRARKIIADHSDFSTRANHASLPMHASRMLAVRIRQLTAVGLSPPNLKTCSLVGRYPGLAPAGEERRDTNARASASSRRTMA
jgi:hypothetical protein